MTKPTFKSPVARCRCC